MIETARESREPRRGRVSFVPYLVFGLGLLVTLAAWRAADAVAESNDNLRFANSVERTHNAIYRRLQSQADLLRGTAAMIEAQGSIDRERFRRYYSSLGKQGALSGVQALALSYRIPPGEHDKVVQQMHSQGVPDFHIFPPGGEEHAILYIEPEDARNNEAVGLNMREHSAERREAMDRARDEGTAILSAKVKLVQEIDQQPQPGFLMYYPVYRGGDPGSPEKRRERLFGFAYSPFRAYDFLDAVLKSERGLDVGVVVYDGTAPEPQNLLYSNLTSRPSQRRRDRNETYFGHQWHFRYAALPKFEDGSGQRLVIWIPIVGTLLSLLLAGLSMMQATAQRALEVQAEELHRREYRQRLLAQAGTILGTSLNVEKTLAAVANLAVPSFADWCAVDILDENGHVRRLAVAHIDPNKLKWAKEIQEKYPVDPEAPTGVPNVLRTGKSELYKVIPRQLLEQAAKTDELRQIIEQLALESAMVVPLTARGKTLGAISFVWAESKRHYDEEDLQLAEEIGARAGLALDNALLFAEKQREEARVRELNENLEHLVKERTNELEASNHELEAFCYSVSHDLRAPLRSVDGFSRAVMEDYGNVLDEQALGYLQRVRGAARRMDELITALLNLSRITRAEIHPERIDLSALAAEAARDASQGTNPVPEFDIQSGMAVDGDPKMIRIVLDNLLSNAVKFSSRSPSPRITVGKDNDGVFVRDNGVGFNPEYAGKLFGAFERLHSPNDFPGSGIGLATVQRIVARHGGRVWAESKEGEGATFWFSL